MKPTVAMSGCDTAGNGIRSNSGIVNEVKKTERGYYVSIELNE